MVDNDVRGSHKKTAEPNQATAALFNMNGRFNEFSGVYIPDEQEVIDAKEFVDENKK